MFELRFDTDTQAFSESMRIECARVLRESARKVEEGVTRGVCLDFNGHHIGRFKLDGGIA